MQESLPEKLTGSQLLKKSHAFYGTRRFITAFTTARHLFLPSLVARRLCIICNVFEFLRWGVVSTSPNTQAGGPPLVGCPLLLIKYICGYPPYLGAVSLSAAWGRLMPWWQAPTYSAKNVVVVVVVVETIIKKGSWLLPSLSWHFS